MGEALGSVLEQLVHNCPAADLSDVPEQPCHIQQPQQGQPEVQRPGDHHQQQQDLRDRFGGAGSAVLTQREAAAVRGAVQLLSGQPDEQAQTSQDFKTTQHVHSDMGQLATARCYGLSGSMEAAGSVNPLQLPADPLSCLFRALDASELVRCLYEVSVRYPALVPTMLGVHMTPLAAYILTSKLEAADKEGVFCDEESSCRDQVSVEGLAHKLSQAHFYCSFYGACGDAEQVRCATDGQGFPCGNRECSTLLF